MTTAPARHGDLDLDDLREHVCRGLTINAVELECLDEREHDRGGRSEERMTETGNPSPSGDDRNTMSHNRAEVLLRRCSTSLMQIRDL